MAEVPRLEIAPLDSLVNNDEGGHHFDAFVLGGCKYVKDVTSNDALLVTNIVLPRVVVLFHKSV